MPNRSLARPAHPRGPSVARTRVGPWRVTTRVVALTETSARFETSVGGPAAGCVVARYDDLDDAVAGHRIWTRRARAAARLVPARASSS